MSKELQDLLCSCCNNDSFGYVNDRYVSQRDDFYDDYDGNDNADSPRYDTSDACDRLPNDYGGLNDDSWDVLSSLKQKFCQLGKLEAERATAKSSPRSSCECTNRPSFEEQSLVERANSFIDYTPESEFLRKIKQHCQYLQNRLPNIFSALNDCFPENGPHECQRCSSDFDECKERPQLSDRKSEHISRSKKPVKHRKIRKRKSKSSEKCESENEFEPSLKKPNENSCERCWRYASPARSPVNKPDQRYDPNFRRAHSAISLDKGDGYFQNLDTGKVCNEGEEMDPDAHINIRQKVEPAPPVQHLCPRHRCPLEVPPVPTQNPCPRHRTSQIQPLPAGAPTQQCSRHRPSLQQLPEPTQIYPKSKCPIHTQEAPQQISPFIQPGPSSFTKVKDGIQGKKISCKHTSDDASRAILYSSPGRKNGTNSCKPDGPSRMAGKSPNTTDDLDVTEYKDICIQPKKQSSGLSASPCNKTVPAKVNTCGVCPKTCTTPKSPKACGQSKLESIPEVEKRTCQPKEESDRKKPPCQKSGLDSSAGDGRGSKDGRSSKDVKSARGSNDGKSARSSNMGSRDEKSGRGSNMGSRDEKSGRGSKDGKEKKHEKSSKDVKTKKQASDKKGKSPKPKPEKPKKSPEKSRVKISPKPQVENSCARKSNQFDKAHPIRHCKCFPRITETEDLSETQGHVLCCHCDWEENRKADASPTPNDGKISSHPGQRPTNKFNGGSCRCTNNSPPRPSCPENETSGSMDPNMECPYRAFVNRCGGPVKPQSGADDRWYKREYYNGNSAQDQSFLQCSPRKYFVFYMTKAKDKNENDVEVLVEELGQGCPDESASRTKDLTEKLKKISEHPSDSMALRFQKGVSEACGIPQSSRVLYF